MSFRLSLLLSAVSAVCVLMASGCSDDASSDDPRCAPGERLRAGECVPARPDAGEEPSDTEDPDGDATDASGDSDGDTDGVDPNAACETGNRACSNAGVPLVCEGGEWSQRGACAAGTTCVLGSCVTEGSCDPGEVVGCSNERQQLVCADDGVRFRSADCPQGLWCLDGTCSERRCFAGETRCADEFTVEICDQDERSYSVSEVCNAQDTDEICVDGACTGGCDFFSKTPTYIGCEYWAADLPNFDESFGIGNPDRQAAVVVANAGERTAIVRIETEDPNIVIPQALQDQEVAPGSIAVIRLPEYNITGTSRSYRSFRILMSEPMVAYQFKPYDNASLASNDATLLLPTNALGSEYYVLSWPGGTEAPGGIGLRPGDGQYGWFSVIATSPGPTQVTITFSDDVRAGPGMPDMRRGTTHEFEMYPGEVLNFEFESQISFINPRTRDATGSRVVADQPIAVFGGHKQAVIGPAGGESGCCADRLEHQMYPVEAWGSTYRVLKSPSRGNEVDRFRVIAARDNTSITTDPPIAGLNGITLNAGEWVGVDSSQSFSVTGTGPILVGQYLLSQQSDGVTRTIGDPTFVLAIPREQYRRSYLLAVPPSYREDYLVVAKPAGVTVRHNGQPLDESIFQPIGSTGDVVGTIAVESGPHRLESSEPFAVQVFGYAGAVSYGYPGGLDLRGLR